MRASVPSRGCKNLTNGNILYCSGSNGWHQREAPKRLYPASVLRPLLREWLTFPARLMEGGLPNFFTINGKAYPATDTVKTKVGQTIKLRFIGTHNNFIHPMHVPGGPFEIVALDGETLPPSARFFADTINVELGQRYDVIWTARAGQVNHALPHSAPHHEQQCRNQGCGRADDDP
jgi:hypothetical protein